MRKSRLMLWVCLVSLVLSLGAQAISKTKLSELAQEILTYTETIKAKMQTAESIKQLQARWYELGWSAKSDEMRAVIEHYYQQLKAEYQYWQEQYQQLEGMIQQARWEERRERWNEQVDRLLTHFDQAKQSFLIKEAQYREDIVQTWQATQAQLGELLEDLEDKAVQYYEDPDKYEKLESAAKKLKEKTLDKLDLF